MIIRKKKSLFFFTADLDPDFVGEPNNVTVTEGSTALLICGVENLGFYRVSFFLIFAWNKMLFLNFMNFSA